MRDQGYQRSAEASSPWFTEIDRTGEWFTEPPKKELYGSRLSDWAQAEALAEVVLLKFRS